MHEDEKGFYRYFFSTKFYESTQNTNVFFFMYLKHSRSDVSLFQDTVMCK